MERRRVIKREMFMNRPVSRTTNRRLNRALALSAAAVLGNAAAALAAPQSYNYTGPNGNWNLGTNWTQVANNLDLAGLPGAVGSYTLNFLNTGTGSRTARPPALSRASLRPNSKENLRIAEFHLIFDI
jgi:hypothetical protein